MKTVVTLMIGFWLGRQFYINYESSKREKKKSVEKDKNE